MKLMVLLMLIFAVGIVEAREAVFYEPFESMAAIASNGGVFSGGTYASNSSLVEGRFGNAIDFTCVYATTACLREAYLTYPRPFSFTQGTIEFWFKFKPGFTGRSYGFFDLGLLYGTHPNSMGVFFNLDYMIFEIRPSDCSLNQAWSSQKLNSSQDWHHAVAMWRCNSQDDFMQVFLDDRAGAKKKFSCTYLPSYTEMWLGNNYYYGSSFSLMDEFRIYDYLRIDNDHDGYYEWEDCDDANAKINPGMREHCLNRIDDNCNGLVDEECNSSSPVFMKPSVDAESAE